MKKAKQKPPQKSAQKQTPQGENGREIVSSRQAILHELSQQREVVRELLENESVTLESIEEMLQRVVHAENPDVLTLELLLSKARDKTVASSGRFFPHILYHLLGLTITADYGDEVSCQIVQLLLGYDKGLVHEVDLRTGMSPLHLASAQGKAKTVFLLLANEANTTLKSRVADGFIPLDYAARYGHRQVVGILLSCIPKELDISKSLYLAAQYGHIGVVEVLLNYDPLVVNRCCPMTGLSALHAASATGQDKVVALLLKFGLDVSFCFDADNDALVLAVQGGHTKVVRILHNEYQKKQLLVNRVSLLYFAVGKGYADMLEIFLQDPDDSIKSLFRHVSGYAALFVAPLHIAAEAGHADIVERLLKYSPGNVDIVDNCGRTSLHIAAQKGHIDVVKKLLAYGANPAKIQDGQVVDSIGLRSILLKPLEDGKTPLQIAQQLGHEEVVQLFLGFEKEKILALLLPVLQLSNMNKTDVAVEIENRKLKLSFRNTQKAQVFLKSLCMDFSGEVVNAELSKNSVSLTLPIQIGKRRASKVQGYAEEIHRLWEFLKQRFGILRWHMVSATMRDGGRYYGIQCYGNKPDLQKLRQAIIEINNPCVSMTVSDSQDSIRFEFPEVIFENSRLRDDIGEKLKIPYKIVSTQTQKKEEVPAHRKAIKPGEEEQQREMSRKNDHEQKLIEMAKNGLFINIKELLTKEKINVNGQDEFGRTALHYAVQGDLTEVIEILMEFKADVNVKSNTGNTPLQGASLFGAVEAAKMLIANGADVNATNNNGKTALRLAVSKGHVEIVELLEPLTFSKEKEKEKEEKEETKEEKEISEGVEPESYSLEAPMGWMDLSTIVHSNSAFFRNSAASSSNASSSSSSSSASPSRKF